MTTENDTIIDTRAGIYRDVTEQTITSSTTLYFPLDSTLFVNIMVVKGINNVTVSVSTTGKKDIELGIYLPRSTGTKNYFPGDFTGITAIKVEVDFVSGGVGLAIKQYRRP